MRARRSSIGGVAALSVLASLLASAGEARAQGARPGAQSGPTQSSPTRSTQVGPQRRGGDGDEPSGPSASARPSGQPSATAPQDPLAVPEGVSERIGTDHDGDRPSPEGTVHRSFFPLYEERRGDYRMRLLPPFYLEHSRGLDPVTAAPTPRTDTESLSALVFYQRRSRKVDADVLFPIFWRVRDEQSHLLALGPIVHREAPGEHDNWLAPLFFEGERKDGGYFHSPILLTTSHWNKDGAFTLAGPYFRDRTGSDVDWGVAPFVFHGDNGNQDGARRVYTLIPPLLYFHREREIDESKLTVLGPVLAESDAKREVLDVLPFYFSIRGKPEGGGVRESHTTLFPFFHYGTSPTQSLFVTPLYLRRVTKTVDTMLTPLVSYATERNGAARTTVVGPIVPIFYRRVEDDVGYKGLGIFPFYFGSSSPKGETLLTPLFGRVESYNVSRTYWIFPTIQLTKDIGGWETNLHPFIYLGRDKDSSHTVLAPVFWDFASPKSRTTIGFPVFWRFADAEAGTVTQVAANTLYRERRVPGGKDWEFHVLPLFSYGETPRGHWWNVLFGLAGYDRDGASANVKAFWIPIPVAGGGSQSSSTATR